jgi:hypothetical protein
MLHGDREIFSPRPAKEKSPDVIETIIPHRFRAHGRRFKLRGGC